MYIKNYSTKIKVQISNQGVFRGLIYSFKKMTDRLFTKIVIKIEGQVYKKKPVNSRRVLFVSTPDYSDNACAISEYMQLNYKDYELIWLVSNAEKFACEGIKFVTFKNRYGELSRKCIPYIFSAKYIFFTHESPYSIRWFGGKLHNEQIVINLWHGCGFKDKVRNENMPFVKKEYFDYAVVPGDIFIETKTKFWGCLPQQILPIGYPRYNWMITESSRAEQYMHELKGEAGFVVIWMPTFRNNQNSYMPENDIKYDYDIPLMKSERDVRRLNEYCGHLKIKLIIKRHPQQKVYSCENNQYSNIRFISNEDLDAGKVQLYELLQYTDALISDYSSISFDYLVLDKPMAFCLDDYEIYSMGRGFVFENSLDYMPGKHMYSFDDMIGFLDEVTIGKDSYADERKQIRSMALNEQKDYCEAILDAVGLEQ